MTTPYLPRDFAGARVDKRVAGGDASGGKALDSGMAARRYWWGQGLGQRLGWRVDTQNSDGVVQVLGLDFQCSWGGLFKNWRYLPLLSVTYRYEALFSEV